ncbi:MAG: HAMP domain-containing protein [Acidobacteriaceae bacterium]|nr:HAMP domain-containing protein [Acidobacteriaceae bacterium]MBV8571061.1 HAMP domain-containing protein [Acidobacteriaceae bacterium]
MRRRFVLAAAALVFLLLLALLVWQGSFSFSFGPTNVAETIVLSAVSTVIFLLTVTLAFMLFRAGVKLYIDRQRDREGSRIRSKLLAGALALTLAPTLFATLFNYTVLNRTLDKWFTQPARGIEVNLKELDAAFKKEAAQRVQAQADWLSLLPQIHDAAQNGRVDTAFFHDICVKRGIRQLILNRTGGVPVLLYQNFASPVPELIRASAVISSNGNNIGSIEVSSALADGPRQKENLVARYMNEQQQLGGRKKFYQDTYYLLICLLTLFVLFFAAWSAQLLSRHISVPISALLRAAQEVRRGNLSTRVNVGAIDELATLVRAFNEMTGDLESNAQELEARRRFTEAILQSIPTGVISVSTDERIERVNRALASILPEDSVRFARRLEDLFNGEDLAEIRYLLKRARRTGAAACQLEMNRESTVLHLAVTAASLQEQRGFVMVIEDTSDLLRAQKAIAWQEVARRVAHEIKNPLTPISLCADRIARQLGRLPLEPETRAILDECTTIIQQEVETVKSLVDEFSQFSRFPTAQPVPADLNDIVESAKAVFAGRLDGISISYDLDPRIPPVMADREQIKRVIVNLIDNAAEAMSDSPVRELLIATSATADVVELSVTDTGCGVSMSDKEKLFLPYFSTKERGTGLGLAIVSRIVNEHHARVRVEDNFPRGTRFTVEFNALPGGETQTVSSVEESSPATLKT